MHENESTNSINSINSINAISELEPIQRLTSDLKQASLTLSPKEARYIVDAYYTIQDYRKAADNQRRSLEESSEPHSVILWLLKQHSTLEAQLKRALDSWTDAGIVSPWAKTIVGIGPVISAGLAANIIHIPHTAGKIWRYAGLDPSQEWLGRERATTLVNGLWDEERFKEQSNQQSGEQSYCMELVVQIAKKINYNPHNLWLIATQDREGATVPASKKTIVAALAKRPFNARLKLLQWKIGESFVKVQNIDGDFYGKIYRQRRDYEAIKNLKGDYAQQAKEHLERFNIDRNTEAYAAYKEGRLPEGHIYMRSKRYAVKLFLAHWHEVAYQEMYKKMPPKPYILEHSDGVHTHKIEVPNNPFKGSI